MLLTQVMRENLRIEAVSLELYLYTQLRLDALTNKTAWQQAGNKEHVCLSALTSAQALQELAQSMKWSNSQQTLLQAIVSGLEELIASVRGGGQDPMVQPDTCC